MLKKILIVVGAIIAIMLIIPLFMSKDYHLSREVVINKPNAEVFNYVRYLKNQDNYSKWVMMDPNKEVAFRGVDGTEGFVYAWDSKKGQSGKGEQEIKNIEEGRKVDIEVRFEKPMKSVGYTPIITEPLSATQTKVRWEYNTKANYLVNVMRLYAGMDEMLGNDMQESLDRLKNIVEQQPVAQTEK